MKCSYCGKEEETRLGACWECATEGDIRLAKRGFLEHWFRAAVHLLLGARDLAKLDFKLGWHRIWRTGEYAPGREWENY
jgi:hypothetical protein